MMKRVVAVLFAVFLCIGLNGCGVKVENVGQMMFEHTSVPPAGYYVVMVTMDQEAYGGRFDPNAGWLRIDEDGTGECYYQEITYQVTTDESNLYLDGEQVVCQYVKQKFPPAETVVLEIHDQSTDTRHIVMLYAMPQPDDR